MNRIIFYSILAIFLGLTSTLNSCTKDVYELGVVEGIIDGKPTTGETTPIFPGVENNDEYFVNLNGSALQVGDVAKWTVKTGRLHDKFVRFDNSENPITKFFGIPGEKYILEWVVERKGKTIKEEVNVQIKEPSFAIENITPSNYKTKIALKVYQHLKGKWTFDKKIASIRGLEHYGVSGPQEEYQVVEIQGFENTDYHIKWTYTLFDKEFVLDTVIKTGNYTQEEALRDIGFKPDSRYVTWNKNGEVIEIDMHSNGYAWIFDNWESYPALRALKHVKKLNFYASSLGTFPELFTKYYLNLEDLNMSATGFKIEIPSSIKNLKKLKRFRWSNLFTSQVSFGQLFYPEEFGELESLEELHTNWSEGIVLPKSFSKLKNLKAITGTYQHMPNNIGGLKKLTHLDAIFLEGEISQSISQATSLKSLRVNLAKGRYTSLPRDIGNLKELIHLELSGSGHIGDLPTSFSSLTSLDTLMIEGPTVGRLNEDFSNLKKLRLLTIRTSASQLPESFSNLSNLNSLQLIGQNLKTLPKNFGNLQSLIYLGISGGVKSLPNTFADLKNLIEINLEQNMLATLPDNFGNLKADKINLSNNLFSEFPVPLTNLSATHTIILNNNIIKVLPESVLKLKNSLVYLELHQNYEIPLDNLISIAKRMPSTIIYRNEFNSFQIPRNIN